METPRLPDETNSKPDMVEVLKGLGLVRPANPHWNDAVPLMRGPRLERLAVVYKRQSLYEQVRNNVWSLLLQDELEKIAIGHGFYAPLSHEEIEAEKKASGYPHHYRNGNIWVEERDLGMSGTLGPEDRPGLEEIICMIQAGLVAAIYVVEISRLWRDKALSGEAGDKKAKAGARSRARASAKRSGQWSRKPDHKTKRVIDTDGVIKFAQLCKNNDVLIILPYGIIDLRTDGGWEQFVNGALKAAQELQQMQRRLGKARRAKAAKGLYPGGAVVPVGYQVETDKQSPYYQKLVPLEPHDAVLRKIIQQFVAFNGSYFSVMRWARKEGLRFPPLPAEVVQRIKGQYAFLRGNDGSDGWPVTVDIVRSIVRNPVYGGVWQYAGEVIPNNHPAIVPVELMTQALTLAMSRRPQSRDDKTSQSLLAGILWCYNHKEPLPVSSAGGMYVCQHDYRKGLSVHVCLSLTDYILDKPIAELIQRELQFPDLVDQVLRELQQVSDDDVILAEKRQQRVGELRKQIENIQENRKKLFRSTFTLPETFAEMEQEIKSLRWELMQMETGPELIGPSYTDEELALVRDLVSNLGKYWKDLTPERRRQIVTQLALEEVHIKHNRARIWCRVVWKTGATQEMVVHRPFVDYRQPWTPEEDALVLQHYSTATEDELMAMLSHRRTWVAITKRALALARREETEEQRREREAKGEKLVLRDVARNGGDGPNPWSDTELQHLRRYYDGKISKAALQAILAGRSWCSIKTRANRIGLRWHGERSWVGSLKVEMVPDGTFDSQ